MQSRVKKLKLLQLNIKLFKIFTPATPHPQIESFLMAFQVQMLLLLLCISMLYGRLLILEYWFFLEKLIPTFSNYVYLATLTTGWTKSRAAYYTKAVNLVILHSNQLFLNVPTGLFYLPQRLNLAPCKRRGWPRVLSVTLIFISRFSF